MKLSEKIFCIIKDDFLFPEVLKLLVCTVLTVGYLNWSVYMMMLTMANVHRAWYPLPVLPRRT